MDSLATWSPDTFEAESFHPLDISITVRCELLGRARVLTTRFGNKKRIFQALVDRAVFYGIIRIVAVLREQGVRCVGRGLVDFDINYRADLAEQSAGTV